MKQSIKLIKTTAHILLWSFLVFSVAATVLTIIARVGENGLPSIFGKSLVTIRSASMEPVIREGDLIVDEVLTEEEKRNLAVGDIITFYADLDGDGDYEINTHRIIDVRQTASRTFYTTQGENNTLPDEEAVTDRQVLGRYTGKRIGGVGSFILFLQSSVGFFCCILLPLLLFFLSQLMHFISVVREIGRERAAAREEEIKRRAVEEYLRQQAEREKEGN